MKHIALIALMLAACMHAGNTEQPRSVPVSEAVDRPNATFTISKGNHYCRPRKVQTAKKLEFTVYIDQSWIHTEKNPGWNKLIGISDGLNHQRNSIRIVWRCIDGQIIFAAYAYQNGKWTANQFPGGYYPGTWKRGKVEINNTHYLATFDGVLHAFRRTGRGTNLVLWPYFGGKDTAHHGMIFKFSFK